MEDNNAVPAPPASRRALRLVLVSSVAGALVALAASHLVARVMRHDTEKACSPDGRVCVTREQAPALLFAPRFDRLWVSVDMHDQCGTEYVTPFGLPAGELQPTFTKAYVELRSSDGSAVRYTTDALLTERAGSPLPSAV